MKKITGKTLIVAAVLIAFVVLLFNPSLLFFLSEETRLAVHLAMQKAFGRSGEIKLISLPTLLSLLAVIAFIMALNRIFRFVFGKIVLKSGRSRTLGGLLFSGVNYATAIIGIIWCLSLLGVNVTGIFASLGLLGLVVGFGAQSLIGDIITGIFIIFEGQYNIGDIIILDGFRGTVKEIGIRTTRLLDAGGNVKIVNNSDVRNMQNLSHNLSVVLCDIGISYDADLLRVEDVITAALPAITRASDGLFPQPIVYLGVEELAPSAVVLRVMGSVQEADIFAAQRYLNRAMKLLFDANNIDIPYPQLTVHEKTQEKPS
ncbi:MAG: mechanosensitive ion channel family protein [Ruthenibacterium sp.]